MSQYPKPTLHNGSLNTSFNTSDFTSTSKLNSTQVSGPLVVAGLGTFNSGLQVYGNENITGGLVASSATISSTVTLPSTQVLSNTTTLVDLASPQSISSVKTFLSAPVISTITNTGTITLPTTTDTLVGRATTDTFTGIKTFTANPVISAITNTGTITLPTTTDTLVGRATTDVFTGSKTFSSIITANGGVQLPTPTALTASATPTVNCLNYTNGAFTMTMSANITGFTFSNPRAGGQYAIFLTGGASAFTIAVTLTGTPAIKTNYATAVTVPIAGKAVVSAYYDGTNMFVNASSYV